MNDTRYFIIPLPAQGKQRARVANGHAYTPKETRIYEADVKRLYEAQCHFEPFAKGVPVHLRVVWSYAIPKSANVKRRQAMLSGVEKPTVKPDLSNAVKTIEDALNGLAYYDDAQITKEETAKRYGIEAYAKVYLSIDDE